MIELPLHPPVRKIPRCIARKFVAFIHGFPCSIPNCKNTDIHGHHTMQLKRAGNWASDLCVIPLCGEHHNLGSKSIHALGIDGFEKEYSVNVFLIILRLWELFYEENFREN